MSCIRGFFSAQPGLPIELHALIIQETIKNPIGADETLLKDIRNDLNSANSFFSETEKLT